MPSPPSSPARHTPASLPALSYADSPASASPTLDHPRSLKVARHLFLPRMCLPASRSIKSLRPCPRCPRAGPRSPHLPALWRLGAWEPAPARPLVFACPSCPASFASEQGRLPELVCSPNNISPDVYHQTVFITGQSVCVVVTQPFVYGRAVVVTMIRRLCVCAASPSRVSHKLRQTVQRAGHARCVFVVCCCSSRVWQGRGATIMCVGASCITSAGGVLV